MKINYILLGVTIILIILMMCSNKTEGFREGQYKVEARSQGCAPGAEIKSVAACKRAASIAVPKLRRGGPIFHGPGGNPLARAFGLSMFKGCSVKDLRGNPSFGKYTYFNTAGSYRGNGNANLKDHPAICKSSPQHPKAAPPPAKEEGYSLAAPTRTCQGDGKTQITSWPDCTKAINELKKQGVLPGQVTLGYNSGPRSIPLRHAPQGCYTYWARPHRMDYRGVHPQFFNTSKYHNTGIDRHIDAGNRAVCGSSPPAKEERKPGEIYLAKEGAELGAMEGVCPPEDEIKDVEECRTASIKFGGSAQNNKARYGHPFPYVSQARGSPSWVPGCQQQKGDKVAYFMTGVKHPGQDSYRVAWRAKYNQGAQNMRGICKRKAAPPPAKEKGFASSVRLAPIGQLCPELERIKTPAECGRALLKLRDEQKDGDLFKSGTGLHGASSPGSSQWAGFGDSRFGYKGKILHPLEGNFSGVPQGCGVHTSYRGRQRKSHNYVYWNRQNPRLAQGPAQMYQAVCATSPCPPRGAAPKISEITGDYDVYYKGVKRTGAHNGGRGLQITCDGVATQPGVFIDKIHSKDVQGKCKEERDCQSTFYITKTHGANKHECLRKEGDKIVGNHYINNGQFWGAVEYRPKANQDPKYDCNKPPPPPPPPPPKRSNAAKPEPPPEPPAPPPPAKKKQQCPKLELAPKPSWCKALDGPLVDDPAPPEPVEERGGPKQPPPAPAPIPPAPPPPPKIISAPPPAPPPLPPPPPPPISPKPKSTCGSILHDDPDQSKVPNGWKLCYIGPKDTQYHQHQCKDLLKDTTYGDAEGIKKAGMNYGCWHGLGSNASNATNNVVSKGCRPNVQHTTKLRAWGQPNTVLGVCYGPKR